MEQQNIQSLIINSSRKILPRKKNPYSNPNPNPNPNSFCVFFSGFFFLTPFIMRESGDLMIINNQQ